jgi:Concanavalin A-like lectin/glucanases superfamily
MSALLTKASTQWFDLGATLPAVQNVAGATLVCWATYNGGSTGEDRCVYFSQGTAEANSRASISQRNNAAGAYRASGRRLDADAASSADSTTAASATKRHVAAVFRYSAGALEIYVDGVLETTLAIGGWTANSSNTASLGAALGGRSDGVGTMNGLLEGCRVYNRALSAQEIGNLFQARGGDGNVFGLVHRWQLQDGAPGATNFGAVDSGVGARNGTPTGTPFITFGNWLSRSHRRRSRSQ